ncbi:MAG TPA: hypothetical protein VFV97_16580 [Rhodanobacteraceae bacterium]|nr:hypothetical protein [Rhodanobacteraceae bacterium]
MGFSWLSTGITGALEAGLIALAIGALLCALCHHLGRRAGWKQGTEIGVAFIATLFIAAGADAWDLFHLSIVRMESPFVIAETLADIYDPAYLGTRVVFEFCGAIAGVMIGWYVAAVALRGRRD